MCQCRSPECTATYFFYALRDIDFAKIYAFTKCTHANFLYSIRNNRFLKILTSCKSTITDDANALRNRYLRQLLTAECIYTYPYHTVFHAVLTDVFRDRNIALLQIY